MTSGQLLALIEEASAMPGASAPAIVASADGGERLGGPGGGGCAN